jgi:hypothetical protein
MSTRMSRSPKPSCDAPLKKTEHKKRWIESFHTALDTT